MGFEYDHASSASRIAWMREFTEPEPREPANGPIGLPRKAYAHFVDGGVTVKASPHSRLGCGQTNIRPPGDQEEQFIAN